MKRIILFIFPIIYSLYSFSQTTYVNGSYTTGNRKECGRLKSVTISENGVTVAIEIKALKRTKRLKIIQSRNTYIKTGETKLLKLTGIVHNNTIEDIDTYSGWGWDDVAAGETRTYELYFKGVMPSGITKFSIVDEGDIFGAHGYGFRNYPINNPRKNYIGYYDSEYKVKQDIDSNNDGYCGIYESIEANQVIACIKINGEHKLIHLKCPNSWEYHDFWQIGDIKANLRPTSSGIFYADWYSGDKQENYKAYAVIDGISLKVRFDDGSDITYLKSYPVSSNRGSGKIDNSVEWTGTGFALTNNYIVTNNHVVEGAKSIYIQGVNGNFDNKHSATVVATDKYNDLALLKVNDCTISSASIPYSIKTSTTDVGEEIFVLGYPLTSTMGDEIKLTTGVVSSKTGFQGNVSMYQISAPIQPGNSGGPLFDSKGNVIGIVSAKHQGAENVGYAIKASYLQGLIESATSVDILPHNNKISTLNLTNKVKAVKNFVYYITCSSNSISSNSGTSNSDGIGSNSNGSSHSDGASYSSGKTYNNPSIRTNCSNNTKILSVTLEDNRTIVKMSNNNRTRNGGYYAWMTIDPNTYIKVNGKKYSLTGAEGIAISPNRTTFSYEGETKTFTLYFPAIPKTTTSMDLIESVSSEWQFYGIQLNSSSRKQNAESLFE